MKSLEKIETELNYLDRTSASFARTRLLVIIAQLLFIIVRRGSAM